MTRNIIKDEEFEDLNFYEQRNYLWCETCNVFYHVESDHSCNEYNNYLGSLLDPRD